MTFEKANQKKAFHFMKKKLDTIERKWIGLQNSGMFESGQVESKPEGYSERYYDKANTISKKYA